jgi:hypothetical protein
MNTAQVPELFNNRTARSFRSWSFLSDFATGAVYPKEKASRNFPVPPGIHKSRAKTYFPYPLF